MARMAESIKLATELVFEVAESIEKAAKELLDMGARGPDGHPGQLPDRVRAELPRRDQQD
jgi:hypothetical protein